MLWTGCLRYQELVMAYHEGFAFVRMMFVSLVILAFFCFKEKEESLERGYREAWLQLGDGVLELWKDKLSLLRIGRDAQRSSGVAI